MNKYWIHKASGQKAKVYKEGDPVKLSWKHDTHSNTYIEVTKECLEEFYIPITEVEYNSNITLREIEVNRYDLFSRLVKNDTIICKSDCKSLSNIDIEAGDALRVNSIAENIATLYGLTEGIKCKAFTVTKENINNHFLLYNTEDRTEEYVHKEKKNTVEDTFESLCQDMIATYKAKNHDYGNSFHSLFKELGINYAYGHLKEKLERIKTLKDNETKVKSESMIDSLKDLANYSIMTIIELQYGKEE